MPETVVKAAGSGSKRDPWSVAPWHRLRQKTPHTALGLHVSQPFGIGCVTGRWSAAGGTGAQPHVIPCHHLGVMWDA